MDDAPVPPIVLLDTGGRSPFGPPQGSEPLTFESVGTLLNYIEAIDVRDGNLDAFDAEGRRIELTAESDKDPINWAIRQERYPAELEEFARGDNPASRPDEIRTHRCRPPPRRSSTRAVASGPRVRALPA